jgi:AcrR family transcriptional regulator
LDGISLALEQAGNSRFPEISMTTPQPSSNRRTRGRPKVDEVALIEGELLKIALEQFVKHGYGGTSMSRIIKAAGISKTTMYSRFSSKEDLFRAIMREQIDRVSATMPLGPPNSPLDLERGLRNYGNRAIEVSMEGSLLEVNRLIYSEARRFPELGAAANERHVIGVRQISDFIRHCAEADGIPCEDPESIAEVFILAMRGWYVNMLLSSREVPATVRSDWVERAVRTLVASRREW